VHALSLIQFFNILGGISSAILMSSNSLEDVMEMLDTMKRSGDDPRTIQEIIRELSNNLHIDDSDSVGSGPILEHGVGGDDDDDGDGNDSNIDEDEEDAGNNLNHIGGARVFIHDPYIHAGAVGFAPPHGDIRIFLYKNCDCRHHTLTECCFNSVPPFRFFSDQDDADLRINFVEETAFALRNYNTPNCFLLPNNKQRKRLYAKVFLALDFGGLLPGERRKLPNCVCAKIRSIYPDESGYYMEFKEGRLVPRDGL
jgi:hypothetical protein